MQTVIEVRRIDLWTLFKVSFFVYAVLGLIGGFFYFFFMMLVTGIGGALIEEELPGFGMLGGFLGLILMPVLAFLYGAIGSVMVTICGAIINLIMRGTGGVKFDVDVWPVSGLVQAPAAPAPPETPVVPAPPQPPAPGSPPPPERTTPPESTPPRDGGSPGTPPGYSGPQG
jgi:hypothetical protein